MTRTVGIVGAGKVAQRLKLRLEEMGYNVLYLINRRGFIPGNGEFVESDSPFQEALESRNKPGVMFVANSTLDNGEAATSYITQSCEAGITAITCEKGALAHYPDKVLGYAHEGLLKYNASVTGGVLGLAYLKLRNPRQHKPEIHAVLNGTCNLFFDEVSRNSLSREAACDLAVAMGYAEPGSSGPLSMTNSELVDKVRKTCVLHNTSLSEGEWLTPDQIGKFELDASQLRELTRKNYRLVVSFLPDGRGEKFDFFPGHFSVRVKGWEICGGFCNLQDEPKLRSWVPPGPKNAIQIIEGGDEYTVVGPGAGLNATTRAMINDLTN